MQDAKEEVRSRLNIEDVIGEYVQLRRAGRNFKGLSPFSGEKTPSFVVSPEKHIWHDFSSGKGGDLFSFVMEAEGIDFRQALELLARRAGVDLSVYQTSGSQQLTQKKKRLQEANDWAATYYQKSLISNPHAVDYIFKKRGLSKKIVQDFRIGYAPDSGDALKQFLTKKGYSAQEISDAGLANRFGGDLFRGRMMVPLMDGTGQVIGFTGRIIVDDPKAPKYLNTPQTLLYDKSRHVFGLSQAKEAIKAKDYAVVVEGNLDVVSSHQADVSQVVATAGTAMTEHHLRTLGRLTSKIRLAFDGDKAGLAATERAIPIAQTVGVDLSIITLPGEAKDPDELIKQDPTLWQQAIEASQPVVEWVIEQFAAREDLQTAAGKTAFTTAALNVIRNLKDAVEQDHYIAQIAQRIGTSREALDRKLASVEIVEAPVKQVRSLAPTEPREEEMTHDNNQDALLAIALVDVDVQALFVGSEASMFDGAPRQAVARYIAEKVGEATTTVPKGLETHEKYVTMLLLHPDADKVIWQKENRVATAKDMIRSLNAKYQKKTKEELSRQEREARERGDDAAAIAYLRQINLLIRGEK